MEIYTKLDIVKEKKMIKLPKVTSKTNISRFTQTHHVEFSW